MSLKRMKREYRETPRQEIWQAIFENTIYGFLGSVIVVFITKGIDIAVLLGYVSYYFFLGRVVNRPKYVTQIGKFILFPVPTALGDFTGYKLAGLLSDLFW